MNTPSEFMSLEQAAQWLGKTPEWVAKNSKGRGAPIPATWINDRVVYFHRETILSAFAKRAGLTIPPSHFADPHTPAACPLQEPAASTAETGSAAGEPLSAMRVPAGGVSRMPGVTPQPLPARAGAPVLAPISEGGRQ